MFIIPTQTAFHVIIIAIIFKNKFYATACITLGMHGMAWHSKYIYPFIITISKSLRFNVAIPESAIGN